MCEIVELVTRTAVASLGNRRANSIHSGKPLAQPSYKALDKMLRHNTGNLTHVTVKFRQLNKVTRDAWFPDQSRTTGLAIQKPAFFMRNDSLKIQWKKSNVPFFTIFTHFFSTHMFSRAVFSVVKGDFNFWKYCFYLEDLQ